MKLIRKAGATSEIWQIFIADSSSTTGAGLTGLTNASSGLTAYYHRDTDTSATVISLVSMTVGTFTSSGFKEIDNTNMPGWYQFCPPNAAIAAGAKSCAFHLKGATNMAPLPIEVDLDSQVDVTFWNGTVVATPATAGIPDVNAKNINNVATTSVTTINANIGQTQPVNFTGTGSSAYVKSDLQTIKTQAVTCAAGVTILASVGTATTDTAQSGDSYGIVNSGSIGNSVIMANVDGVYDLFPPNFDSLAVETPSGGVFLSTTQAAQLTAAANLAAGVNVTKYNGEDVDAAVNGKIPVDVQAWRQSLPNTLDGSGNVLAALDSTQRDAIATALLDLANAIDSHTVRQALRYIAAMTVGTLSGSQTATEVFKGLDGSTTRVTQSTDASGNRTPTLN